MSHWKLFHQLWQLQCILIMIVLKVFNSISCSTIHSFIFQLINSLCSSDSKITHTKVPIFFIILKSQFPYFIKLVIKYYRYLCTNSTNWHWITSSNHMTFFQQYSQVIMYFWPKVYELSLCCNNFYYTSFDSNFRLIWKPKTLLLCYTVKSTLHF